MSQAVGESGRGSEVVAAHAAALGSWLAEVSERFEAPVAEVRFIQGGRSNLTFLLVDATGRKYVLRRPPLGDHAGKAHDVLREAKIIAAMARAGLPVPEIIAEGDDPTLIGTPFFVMTFVEGHVLTRPQEALDAGFATTPASARELARSVTSTLAAIHAVDIDSAGLADLRRRGSYVERQLRRFSGSVSKLPDSPGRTALLALHDRLAEQAPAPQSESIVHGDYKLGNVMVADSGEVVAVLDWELASTGEATADIGWLVASWAQPQDGRWLVPPATLAGGFPGRAEIAELYAEAAGRAVTDLDYYVAFAYWRWSAINLGTRQRFLDGATAGAVIDIDALDGQVRWQLERTSELLAP